MNSWVLSVGAVVILTTMAGFIVPEGKLGKYVKGIFGVLVLLVVIKPIINFNFSDVTTGVEVEEIVVQKDYVEFIYNKKNEQLQKDVTKLIEKIGVTDAIVKISHNTTEKYGYVIKNVIINLKNAVIKSDKEHIVIIEEVKTIASEYLTVNKNLVEIMQ